MDFSTEKVCLAAICIKDFTSGIAAETQQTMPTNLRKAPRSMLYEP
jgi:hypothetical protein